jgi:hypothetical protein
MMYDIYSLAKRGVREIENTEPSNLLSALKVPPGMEDEYLLAMSGYYPYDPNAKKILAKLKKTVGTSESVVGKLKKARIKGGVFQVDLLIYNQDKNPFKGAVNVSCVLKNEKKEVLRKLSKKIELSMKPEEAIVLKDVKMGKIDPKTARAIKKVRCSLSSRR